MKIVVIFSGGIDSTTLLYQLVKKHGRHNIKALTFDYGQKNKKYELIYSYDTCKKLGVEHHIVDIRSITNLIADSALINKKIDIPEDHYENEIMKLTVVPNRNMIMLAIAIGYAENINYNAVAIGVQVGGEGITQYPDVTEEFIKPLEQASKVATSNNIIILRPFINMLKKDIIKIGLEMGIDYDLDTYTCYKGEEEPCGKCGACVKRLEGMELAKQELGE